MSGLPSKLKIKTFKTKKKHRQKLEFFGIKCKRGEQHWLVYEQENNCKFISTVCVTCNLLWKSYLIARCCRAVSANNYNYFVSAIFRVCVGGCSMETMCRIHLKYFMLEFIREIFNIWVESISSVALGMFLGEFQTLTHG